MTQAYVVAVAAVFLFFASLVMHELGHALAARREGIEISGIDLWFFGGVAKMARDTQSAGAEFRIAAAGPLVTLVLFGLFFGLSALVQNGAALDVVRLAGDSGGLADAGPARLPGDDQPDAASSSTSSRRSRSTAAGSRARVVMADHRRSQPRDADRRAARRRASPTC